jgi:hypothetical protein
MGANTEIVFCGERERKEWDGFLEQTPSATICHHYLWQTVIQSAYGHQPFYLLARDGGRVQGVLPLVLVSSRLFGSSLTSMPFLDYGGVRWSMYGTREHYGRACESSPTPHARTYD